MRKSEKPKKKRRVRAGVGVFVEVPPALREALREMKVPIADTARKAFVEAVKRAAGEKALGKKLEGLVPAARPGSGFPFTEGTRAIESDDY